mmetsp:Transcript_76981/g.135709  ORF Transcript_76981/g.135709 Transcript_76981/m.135709 type:complete len:200 (+) Transcript_76981:938-1537(+)
MAATQTQLSGLALSVRFVQIMTFVEIVTRARCSFTAAALRHRKTSSASSFQAVGAKGKLAKALRKELVIQAVIGRHGLPKIQRVSLVSSLKWLKLRGPFPATVSAACLSDHLLVCRCLAWNRCARSSSRTPSLAPSSGAGQLGKATTKAKGSRPKAKVKAGIRGHWAQVGEKKPQLLPVRRSLREKLPCSTSLVWAVPR